MRGFVIVTLALASSAARAETPAPDSTPAESSPPAPAPAANPNPDIAKPAPDVPPQKVKEATEVAAKAELTPIIPSPKNPTRPAFQLCAVVGDAVVGSSMGLLVTSVHRSPVKVVPVVNQDTAGKVTGGGLGLSLER